MLCYVFNVRESKYSSKRDDKIAMVGMYLGVLRDPSSILRLYRQRRMMFFFKKGDSDLSRVFFSWFLGY